MSYESKVARTLGVIIHRTRKAWAVVGHVVKACYKVSLIVGIAGFGKQTLVDIFKVTRSKGLRLEFSDLKLMFWIIVKISKLVSPIWIGATVG
jgi:hypothetical protein